MLAFIARRLLQSVVVMLVVAFIAFLVFRYVGDPLTNLLSQDATMADHEAARQRLGLDQPFYVQFYAFVTNALQGQFGVSYRLQQPVSQLILERLPATIELAVASSIIALVFGVLL